jgi:PAS domain S-box-containing protein
MVEDSEDDATLITRELTKGGFDSDALRVQTAEGMKKALEDKKWDIILSDYRMPGFSGLQALKILQESGLDIPFILISGTVGESLAVEAMKAGSCDYVMKDKLNRLDVAIERELRDARTRYERKLTEEALRQSEEKFRILFESSRDALMTLEPPSWTFTSGNPAMIAMFRAKSKEEFISYTPVDLSPEQQPDGSASSKKAGQMIETAMREGSHFFEWMHKRINGEEFPATVLLTRIEVAGKRFLQATIRDITEQKRAEEKLRQSEEKFRRVIETALEGVWFLDSEFKTTEVNDAVVHMLGYAQEELIGRPFIDFVFDEDRPMQVQEFQRRRQGISGQYERRVRCKNGSVKWLFLSAKAVMSAQGALVSSFAMITDITERKLAEEALRQSEARFRILFEQAADIILQMEITPEGMPVIRDVNSAALRHLGYERDELIGKPVSFINVEPNASEAVNERRHNVLSGIGTVFEARHRCKDGTVRDFECSATEMQVGQKTFAVSFERDITERKHAEESLKESEEKFKNVFDNSAIGKSLTFLDGSVHVNPAFCQMLGYTMEEMVLQKWQNISHPDDVELSQKNLNRLLSGEKKSVRFIKRYLKKDGAIIWADVNTVLQKDKEGKLLYYITGVMDITERKQSEKALRESEEKYRSIFENVQDVYYETALDGTILEVSPSIEIISKGQNHRNDLIGKSMHDFYANIGERQALLKALREHGSVADFEVTLKNRDGSLIPCSISSKILFNAQGNPEKIIGSMRDITERKQVEEVLHQSEERYKALFDRSLNLVYIHTFEGQFIDANNMALNLLGYTKEEICSLNFSSLLTEDQLPLALKTLQEISENGAQKETTVYKLRKKNGGDIYIETIGSCILSMGKPVAILGIALDITERKRVEETLRESEERFRAIFDNTGEGILVADISTRKFLFGNHAISRMLGYTDGEIGNLSINDIHQQKDLATVIDAFEKLARREIELAPDLPVLRKDGSVFFADISSFPLSLAGKSYLVGIFHDITQRRTMENEKEHLLAQLLQAQKMEAIGTLAGGVAHDFNNLLTAISGYTSLAMGKIDESDPVQRDLKQVSIAATKAAGVTRQLLLFSRKQHMEPMPMDPNATISHLLKMLDRLIGEDIVIETDLEKDVWSILGDEGNIEQVLMNLSVNARDAMPSGGKLFIKTENVTLDQEYCRTRKTAHPGRFVCLSVSDTGTGMDELTQEHIFEPFFTTKEAGKGTGLGLSVVFGIVQQHKGWINVYSEPGHGTTIKVYFPASSARPEQQSKKEVPLASLQGKGERIMVVEDQAEVRELAVEILKTTGYSVFPVSSAKDAMELFEKENGRFDLVFSDVVLTDMTGILLVEKLLKRWKFGVIITSGYTDEKAHWDFIKENNYRFLHKPYAKHDLLQAVKDVLAEKKS